VPVRVSSGGYEAGKMLIDIVLVGETESTVGGEGGVFV
jgi:hypothetical protein